MLVRHYNTTGFKCEGKCIAALGNFDGVHAGHLALISKAISLARKSNVLSAVITFKERPGKILKKDSTPSITTLDERYRIFDELGVDVVYCFDFNDIKDMQYTEFAKDILSDKLMLTGAVCGYNFRFGKNGVGSAEGLKNLIDNVHILPPVLVNNTIVSSTLIRSLIASGKLIEVSKLLGRPFSVDLRVEHGKELGRKIGVPTINQVFENGIIVPARGVYACKVYFEGQEYSGVSNVGLRPTVEAADRVNLETHIIGFSNMIYDKNVRVSFYEKIRDEKKFSSIEELKNQICLDIATVKKYFGDKNDKTH